MVDATAATNEAGNDGSVVLADLCPGWHTERNRGRLVAYRLGRMSDYQLSHGCLEEITAATVTELVILCDAQNHLGHRVALAAQIAQCFGSPR